MKLALLAAAALIATPLAAQTTPGSMPAPADPSTAPAPNGQSTMTPPPTTTPDGAMNGGAMNGGAMNGGAMSTGAAPMAASGKLPWCRPGQYDGCREHENAQGKGLRKN